MYIDSYNSYNYLSQLRMQVIAMEIIFSLIPWWFCLLGSPIAVIRVMIRIVKVSDDVQET